MFRRSKSDLPPGPEMASANLCKVFRQFTCSWDHNNITSSALRTCHMVLIRRIDLLPNIKRAVLAQYEPVRRHQEGNKRERRKPQHNKVGGEKCFGLVSVCVYMFTYMIWLWLWAVSCQCAALQRRPDPDSCHPRETSRIQQGSAWPAAFLRLQLMMALSIGCSLLVAGTATGPSID